VHNTTRYVDTQLQDPDREPRLGRHPRPVPVQRAAGVPGCGPLLGHDQRGCASMAFPRPAVDLQGSGLMACWAVSLRNGSWLLLLVAGKFTGRARHAAGGGMTGHGRCWCIPCEGEQERRPQLGWLMGVVVVGQRISPYGMLCVGWRSNCNRICIRGQNKGCVYRRVHGWPRVEIASARPATRSNEYVE
jgi:hypothetical protein